MIPLLVSCLNGPLGHWLPVYRLNTSEPPAHTIRGTELLVPEVIQALVARFATCHSGGDARAIVSMWTCWYFGSLIVPATAALLVLDRALPVRLEDVSLVFDAEGKIDAILLPDMDEPLSGDDRFAALIDGHIAPFIRQVACMFAVSPRLLWTNAATILDWAVDQVEVRPLGQAAHCAAKQRLSRPTDSRGCRNPMAGLIRHIEEDGVSARQRRTCCLRYLLPGTDCCGAICPLPEARSRIPAASHRADPLELARR